MSVVIFCMGVFSLFGAWSWRDLSTERVPSYMLARPGDESRQWHRNNDADRRRTFYICLLLAVINFGGLIAKNFV